jgi:hypothetical protein
MPRTVFDALGTQFAAQSAHKDFDRVGVAVKVLRVQVFDQLGARDNLAHPMHQIGQQAVFVGGEADRGPRLGHRAAAGVERDVAAMKQR